MNNNIIVCSPQLGMAPESNSGGEVYDREVIKALCEQGIKIITILPRNKPYIPHKNLKVYYLFVPFVWPPYLFNLLIIPYLFWLYRKEKFHILRVHSPYFIGLGALIFKRFFPKVLLVTTYHHLEENFLFNVINKFFINQWDIIVADSEFTKGEIEAKYRLYNNKIIRIYAGLDNTFQVKPKKQSLIKLYDLTGKIVLLFLGGLKPRKNLTFLLRLMTQLKNKNLKLLICGSGNLRNNLENLSKRLGIEDKIIFTGFIKETDKVDYYNLADIFLFPSLKEGFGMPVIEAAACGVPVIASNISSLKELIIDRQTGYLPKLNDINDWKLKIEKLLGNEDLRKNMGKEAQKFSHKFSWQKCAQQQIKIYKNYIKKF